MIAMKNVIPVEVDTLQDARILFDGDTVNGELISSLTEQTDSVQANEEIESTHLSDSGEESSAESTAEEKNVKYGREEMKPSTSQEIHEAMQNPLIESIGHLLQA